MPSTARQRARQAVLADINAEARRQLARDGAAALSLRSVARELGMVSSGIYRYVASRDDLLTLLIIQAYDDARRRRRTSPQGRGQRPRAIAAGVPLRPRRWAIRHPHEYALVYGSPVPGYAAPPDTIGPAPASTRRWPTRSGTAAGDATPAGQLAELGLAVRRRRRCPRSSAPGCSCSAWCPSSCSATPRASSTITTPSSPTASTHWPTNWGSRRSSSATLVVIEREAGMKNLTSERALRLLSVVIGASIGLQGAWAFLAPRSFFDTLAEFNPYNAHFIRDIGTLQVGVGIAGVVGGLRHRAVVAGLAGLASFQVLHVVSHVVDRDDRRPARLRHPRAQRPRRLHHLGARRRRPPPPPRRDGLSRAAPRQGWPSSAVDVE